MDRGNTKQEILEASLELFSVQGFEATSISQIAGAVGIRKASLYSHFESKQAILDALVKDILEQYATHSLFARTDWENDAHTKGEQALTPDAAAQMILGQIRYILHDPVISRARKMLVIEQFQNPELAKLQTKQNYSDVMDYFTGLVKQLIRRERWQKMIPRSWQPSFVCLFPSGSTSATGNRNGRRRLWSWWISTSGSFSDSISGQEGDSMSKYNALWAWIKENGTDSVASVVRCLAFYQIFYARSCR